MWWTGKILTLIIIIHTPENFRSFQVHHLLKVLSKKRDPVTHVCFMQELLKVMSKIFFFIKDGKIVTRQIEYLFTLSRIFSILYIQENEKSGILTFWESITITLREEFTGAAQSMNLSSFFLLNINFDN